MLDGDAYSTAKPDFNVSAEHAGADTDVQEFCVSWYGKRVGRFSINGGGINWLGYDDPDVEKLFVKRHRDGCPNFLINLNTENPVFEIRDEQDKKVYLKSGLRFLSNFTISPNAPYDSPVGPDHLHGRLKDFTDQEGFFSGIYNTETPKEYNTDFLNKVSECWENKYLPRFSGMEIKLPVYLSATGEITLASDNDRNFTHFVKFPLESSREAWGLNEWIGLELSEAAGLETAKHSMLMLNNDLPPALIVERFDIPSAEEGKNNQYMIRDFCTLTGKYVKDTRKGSMESIGKLVKEFSTNPEEDIRTLYKRSILAWAMKDVDMHRKNVAMLLEYDPEKKDVVKVGMSPTFDTTSDVLLADSKYKMALSIQNKKTVPRPKVLIDFGEELGIPRDEAEAILKDTVGNIARRSVEIAQNLPESLKEFDSCVFTAEKIATNAMNSARFLGVEGLPEWEDVKNLSDKELRKLGIDTRVGVSHLGLA